MSFYIGGVQCTDISFQQQEINVSPIGQVIIPEYNFSCNGRITGYLVRLRLSYYNSDSYPSLQVWHPASSGSGIYNRVGTLCALTANDINRITDSMGYEYYLGNVSYAGDNRIEFQSGDVIGYHQGRYLRYQLLDMRYNYIISHIYETSTPLENININNSSDVHNERPLLEVLFGKNNVSF